MKAEDILKQLALEEKIALGSGANNWQTKDLSKYGLPALFMSDGPHGLRKQDTEEGDALGLNDSMPATCFPAEALSACSWDPGLLEKEGAAIAKEAIVYGVGAVLGPGVCMKRNPLCGRNFEYFAEDPYLAGKLAAGFVKGLEEGGISACIKHFAANNQEFFRFLSKSRMDERTLREIYLTGFEIAAKEGQPGMVMCAYDQLDEKPCASNKRLLTGILRDEWGFDGMVVTDWGAMHNRTDSYKAGCDLAMPGGSAFGEAEAAEAVSSGALSEEDVDKCALRVIRLMLKENWLNEKADRGKLDIEAGNEVAQEVAEGSIVLLKNSGDILPLKEGAKVALIGAMAEKPRFQGAGSSHINPTKMTDLKTCLPHVSFSPGYNEDGSTSRELLDEAADAAKSADVAVICAGLPDSYESEGFDRQSMAMPDGHNELIEAVSSANPNTVVVLMCGSPVETPWEPQVKGILYAGLCGQAGCEATARILSGEVCPSGHLAESWPMKYLDCPSSRFYGDGFVDAEYREGIFMGYRYYDSANVPVRFRFGEGLSYTTFEVSDLEVSEDEVRVNVTNTGKMAGSYVAQMYITPPKAALARPVRELKGFAKVRIEPDETVRITLPLDERSFAVWNDGWKVQKGTYTITIGGLKADIEKDGENISAPEWQKDSWYETFSGTPTREDLEKMCGYSFMDSTAEPGSYTMDSTLEDLARTCAPAREFLDSVVAGIRRMYPDGSPEDNPEFKMMAASTVQIPLSSVIINYGVSESFMKALLDKANGKDVPGFDEMLKEAIARQS